MFYVLFDLSTHRYVCEFDRIGIIHTTDAVERAIRYDSLTLLVQALRAIPDVAIGRQNALRIHRIEEVKMPSQLMDQGAV